MDDPHAGEAAVPEDGCPLLLFGVASWHKAASRFTIGLDFPCKRVTGSITMCGGWGRTHVTAAQIGRGVLS